MGKRYERIDGRLREFVLAQPVFFVGTAPSAPHGHLNVSPKGLTGCFVPLDPICAFAGPPNIVRLHGRGRVHFDHEPRYAELYPLFADPRPGARTVIEVEVERVSDSCGYGVPLLSYEGDRDLLPRFWARKTAEDVAAYRATKNATSIDGLPAVPTG